MLSGFDIVSIAVGAVSVPAGYLVYLGVRHGAGYAFGRLKSWWGSAKRGVANVQAVAAELKANQAVFDARLAAIEAELVKVAPGFAPVVAKVNAGVAVAEAVVGAVAAKS